MNKRVSCLITAFLIANIGGYSYAQSNLPQNQIKPYLQVQPLPGDEKSIRVFFSPNCGFSRNYLQFFRNLATTLPEDKSLIYTPLVNKGDGLIFALSFAAVERFYPRFIDRFIEASMIAVQDKGIATSNWAGIEKIGKAAKLPVSIPTLVQQNQSQIQQDVERMVAIRHHFNILNTPAVSVAGTYIVTPEFTGGDTQLFSQLVNGMISMAQ